jgi:hypothetical protein
MKRMIKTLTVIAIVLGSVQAVAQTTNYQVHSLFVMNIAKYSTWPSQGSEFVITVFGKSKMYDELLKHSAGKSINGLPVKIVQTDNVDEIGNAKILLLADSKSSALDEVLKITEGKAIMVIAEREGLYKKGANFSFVVMDNNTLRFDMNNAVNEKRQIKVSHSLVSLANSVI